MKLRHITSFLLLFVMIICGFCMLPVCTAKAASGTVYTCKLNRCYQHPVSGIIEDSGGMASFASGQGMVEGCTADIAVMEKSDSGNYYLTIRMSLMDLTSGHSFTVQNWGDTEWQDTAAGITGTGSDINGTTNDICIQIPSENAVVRCTMYVEPMGRWVIWYMYASDLTEGKSTDMKTLMVTSPSVQSRTEPSQTASESSAENHTEESSVQENSEPEVSSKEEASVQESSYEEPSEPETSVQESSGTVSVAEEASEASMIPLPKSESVPEAEIQPPQTSLSEEYARDKTRGLILSTEKNVKGGLNSDTKPNGMIVWVIACCAGCAAVVCVIGLIVKHKNRSKLNTEDDTEEYDEDDD